MAPHPWRPTPHKRPRAQADPTRSTGTSQPECPSAAYIQAYEAQLVYPENAAGSSRNSDTSAGGHPRSEADEGGPTLIKWSGGEEGDEEIWADRYNIIHLLPSLPSISTTSSLHRDRATSPTSSSSSWDDLPSDEEELFAISGDEAVETYEREKKRKWLEKLREERLRERAEQDDVLVQQNEAKAITRKAQEDEIPDNIRTLMLHTANSIYSAPNPKSLELRILANHAGDVRFAFLRGKWVGEWERVKRQVRVEKGLEKPEGLKSESVAMLGAYGSDSEDDDDEAEEEGREPGSPPPLPPGPPPDEPPPDRHIGEGRSKLDETSERTLVDGGGTLGTEEGEQEGQNGKGRVDGQGPDSSSPVPDGAADEEKRRMRRQKLMEWKRIKGMGMGKGEQSS